MAAQYNDASLQRIYQQMAYVRMKHLSGESATFAAALRYHLLGLHPIPIHPETKTPLIEWKGYQTARPTREDLYAWWSKDRSARVGLITGAAPGLVVVDIDAQHGGTEQGLDLPPGAYRVATPSGGVHLYYRHPGGTVANRAGVRPGVDIRGDGGYVVAPPSKGYTATAPLILESLPVAPSWVMGRAGKESETSPEANWFARTVTQGTPEGERNDTATRLAGYLLRRDLTPEDTFALLTSWAGRCRPAFPHEELIRVVRSIAGREAAKERERPILQLVAPSSLTVQEITFAIDALVPLGTLTLLYGKDKSGKTLLALEMIRAIRTGQPFLGHFPVATGPVIALLLDDPPGLVRERIVGQLRIPDAGLWVATNAAADSGHPMRLLDALHREALERRPNAIFFDALYVLLAGADQLNKAGGMGPLLRKLNDIAEESGAAVILLHHTRKADNEAAGSFVIRAAAKSILGLARPSGEEEDDAPIASTSRLLRVEGKYLPEAQYALHFAGPGQWEFRGDAAQVRRTDLAGRLLAALSEEAGLTADALAERLSRRKVEVRRTLAQLARDRRVRRQDVSTGGRGRPRQTWFIATPETAQEHPSEPPAIEGGEDADEGDDEDG
jgi:hypothetical protein